MMNIKLRSGDQKFEQYKIQKARYNNVKGQQIFWFERKLVFRDRWEKNTGGEKKTVALFEVAKIRKIFAILYPGSIYLLQQEQLFYQKC